MDDAYENCREMLCESVKLHSTIHHEERTRIVADGLFDAYSDRTPVDQKRLLKAIQLRESRHLKLPLRQFRLQTQLTVAYMRSLRRIRLGNSYFTFSSTPSPKLKVHESVARKISAANVGRSTIDRLTYLCVAIKGRTIADAGWHALDDISLLLGIWNYALNCTVSRRWSWSSTSKEPVNQLRAGPYYTLHDVGDQKPSDKYWHNNPITTTATPIARLEGKWLEVEKVRKWALNRLKAHPYSADMKKALRRYNAALDESDWDAAFLKLWSLIEYLTATASPNSRFDDTLNRASFLWDDPKWSRQVLDFLRNIRNRHVHHSVSPNDAEGAIYSLKPYVEALLRFHLRNDFRFESLNLAGDFLSIAPESQVIRSKMKMLRRALTFREAEG